MGGAPLFTGRRAGCIFILGIIEFQDFFLLIFIPVKNLDVWMPSPTLQIFLETI